MIRKLFLLLIATVAYSQVSITGHFWNPDGTNFSGYLRISLTQTTITNDCTANNQVTAFRPVQVLITNGVLGILSLWASECLQPAGILKATYTGGLTVQGTTGQTCYLRFIGGGGRNGQALVTLSATNTVGSLQVVAQGIQYSVPPSTASVIIGGSATCAGTANVTTVIGIPYVVYVYDTNGNFVYKAQWVVPSGSSADVSTLDIRY